MTDPCNPGNPANGQAREVMVADLLGLFGTARCSAAPSADTKRKRDEVVERVTQVGRY